MVAYLFLKFKKNPFYISVDDVSSRTLAMLSLVEEIFNQLLYCPFYVIWFQFQLNSAQLNCTRHYRQ